MEKHLLATAVNEKWKPLTPALGKRNGANLLPSANPLQGVTNPLSLKAPSGKRQRFEPRAAKLPKVWRFPHTEYAARPLGFESAGCIYCPISYKGATSLPAFFKTIEN